MSFPFSRLLSSAISTCTLLSPVFSPAAETVDYAVKVILFPFREAVLSSEVDSTVLSFEKNEGETFQEKDVLVKLDSSFYDNQLRRAKASLEEAEAAYNYSHENYTILKKMIEGNMASDADVAQTELKIKVAAN